MPDSMDQNPLHDSDLNVDELLEMATDVTIPRGHTDDSIAPVVPLGEDDF